jgi:hypothetical protein
VGIDPPWVVWSSTSASYTTLWRPDRAGKPEIFDMKLEFIAPDLLKLVAPKKLTANDFETLAPEVNELIKRHGSIKLLIDATGLEGWETMADFETHAAFVRDHQAKVDRIALITAHEWQEWLVGVVRVFVHPKIKPFDRDEADKALLWIGSPDL